MCKYPFLNKEPETEKEFFECIDTLGGMIFYGTHDLMHRRVPDEKVALSIQDDINRAQETIEMVVDDLCEKFGVQHPHKKSLDNSPKLPYWDWFESWKFSGKRPEIINEKIILENNLEDNIEEVFEL